MNPVSLLACGAALCCPGRVSQAQVVGTWKFDVSTMRIDLKPQVQQQLKSAGPRGTHALAVVEGKLAQALGHIRFQLKADHSVRIYAVQVPGKRPDTIGSWSLAGDSLKIAVPGQQTVEATFIAKKNRIDEVYHQTEGIMRVSMVHA